MTGFEEILYSVRVTLTKFYEKLNIPNNYIFRVIISNYRYSLRVPISYTFCSKIWLEK